MSAVRRGRPPLAPGTHGTIDPKQRGRTWSCTVGYRDLENAKHEFGASGRTKQECLNDAATKWLGIKKDFETSTGRATTSMRIVVERWLQSVEERVVDEDLAPGTLHQYRSCWKGTLAPVLDNFDVNELTRAQLQELLHEGLFRRDRMGRYRLDENGQRIKVTGRQARQVLRLVLDFAADRGYRKDGMSPLYGTRDRKRPRRAERIDRALTELEWKQLLDMARRAALRPRASKHLYYTLVIMYFTGARIGEAIGLTVEKVDLRASPPRLVIDEKLPETYRVGHVHPLEQTKSRDSRTMVTVSELHDVLSEILATSRFNAPGDPLIATRNGTFVTHANVRTMLRKLVEGTELEWVHPHALRRTFLTAAEATFGIDGAQEMGAHSNKRTTQRHYIVEDKTKVLDPRPMFNRPLAPQPGAGADADTAPKAGTDSASPETSRPGLRAV